MSNIGKTLKQTLSDRGMTATELGRIADVRISFIYDVLSGKSKNPSIVTLSKIANALAIPLSELSGSDQAAVGAGSSSKLSQSYISVPKLECTISADDHAPNTTDTNPILFRRSWIRSDLATQPEPLRRLTVTGDSMEPTLGHGDMLLVDTSKTTPTPPGIFVIDDGYGPVAKRIDIIPGSSPTRLSITSDNPQYAPSERTLDKTHIIGRVVWFGREL